MGYCTYFWKHPYSIYNSYKFTKYHQVIFQQMISKPPSWWHHKAEVKKPFGAEAFILSSGCSGGVCASNNEGLVDVCLDKSPQKGRPDGSLIFMIFPVGVSGIWSISLINTNYVPFGHPWWEVFCAITVLMALADAIYRYVLVVWRLRMLKGRRNTVENWLRSMETLGQLEPLRFPKVRSNWSNGNQTFVAFSLDSLVHLGKLSQRWDFRNVGFSDGSGSSRISWDLNTSIPSTVITELLPRWSRIELTVADPDPRPSYDGCLR